MKASAILSLMAVGAALATPGPDTNTRSIKHRRGLTQDVDLCDSLREKLNEASFKLSGILEEPPHSSKKELVRSVYADVQKAIKALQKVWLFVVFERGQCENANQVCVNVGVVRACARLLLSSGPDAETFKALEGACT